jgi:hypothetical protein
VKIEGFIEGFGFDEIPNFMLRPVVLGKDGERIEPVATKGGFGAKRERFEARFPPMGFPIRLQFEVQPRPLDMEAPPGTTRPAGLDGATAQFTIEP